MEEVKKYLKARKEQLLEWKKEKEDALTGVPEGFLRICSHGGKTQYYKRDNSKDFNGTYIRKKDIHIAKELAQKDYDQKILLAIEKELNVIEKYLSDYPGQNAEEVYENLHSERRKLIIPVKVPDDQYLHEWESVSYQGKGFDEGTQGFYTAKGERVRSKSELIIADLLNREGIPYRYEYPIYLRGIGKVYPDFTVLNVRTRKEFQWEHLGMMDEASYVEKNLQKIAAYERNGIFPGEKLILTFETRKKSINQNQIMVMIQRYLK